MRCLKSNTSDAPGWWCSRAVGHDGPCALRPGAGGWLADGGLALEELDKPARKRLTAAERAGCIVIAALAYGVAIIIVCAAAGIGLRLYRWLS